MEKLVIATRNRGKLGEIAAMLPQTQLLTLDDISFLSEIPEPYDTFEENALQKARTVYDFCGLPVIADDSGLCIDALNGAPGVYSAEYSGLPRSDARNVGRVLEEMKDAARRRAAFVSVICFIKGGDVQYFRGSCEGEIAMAPAGEGGFGYDPIFIPDGFPFTMAELTPEIKNSISHRGRAIAALVAFCRDIC